MLCMILDAHLYTLSLLTGKWGLHHAVIFPQRPRLVDKLDVVDDWRSDAVGHRGVLAGHLGGPLGVEDVEDDVALAHIKVPGNDWGGVDDFYQQLVGGKRSDSVMSQERKKRT